MAYKEANWCPQVLGLELIIRVREVEERQYGEEMYGLISLERENWTKQTLLKLRKHSSLIAFPY